MKNERARQSRVSGQALSRKTIPFAAVLTTAGAFLFASAGGAEQLAFAQVLMALGYPPTHETGSLDQDEWKYWYSRFRTYLVRFGEDGRVESIIGVAPTANNPVR